jgi:AcrR family transcriptional regulator
VEQEGVQPARRRLTQAESREQTRRQLLAAAARVFAQKGFAGASLEEISDLAGYTTGALYYHFANKEQLFLELLRTGWSRQIANWIHAVGDVVADEGADPFDALSRFVVARAEREDDFAPLSAEFWLYALRNPEAMSVITEKLREQADGLRSAIAELMERVATAPGVTPEEMTVVSLELFLGLARRRRIDPDAVPEDLFGRVLRRIFASSAEHDHRSGRQHQVEAEDNAGPI